ncbi:MAG: PIN domain-containing protein [Gemmatimonadota bacterium]
MIVLDTSFLVAFHNERDTHHVAARALMERFLDGEWEEGLLLEYVFLEFVTVLQARLDHAAAVAAGDTLLRARELVFVPASDIFLPTLETFRAEGGGRLSFADAAIVTVARRSAGGQVATFDGGFLAVEGIDVQPPG